LTDLSALQVNSLRSLVHAVLLTILLCACVLQISLWSERSQTLTTPSPEPLAKRSREFGSFANVYTPSSCPRPSCAMNGAANTLSSLVAFTALTYSRALAKGCSAGSRFRAVFSTKLSVRWAVWGFERVFIFYNSRFVSNLFSKCSTEKFAP
jgi:hypothetical protein